MITAIKKFFRDESGFVTIESLVVMGGSVWMTGAVLTDITVATMSLSTKIDNRLDYTSIVAEVLQEYGPQDELIEGAVTDETNVDSASGNGSGSDGAVDCVGNPGNNKCVGNAGENPNGGSDWGSGSNGMSDSGSSGNSGSSSAGNSGSGGSSSSGSSSSGSSGSSGSSSSGTSSSSGSSNGHSHGHGGRGHGRGRP